MANTKIPVELSSTPSIVDNGDSTALTIDSDENIGFNTTGIAAGSTSSSQNSTATPKKIVINNDYSSGYTDASLKLYLFNSGTTRQGFTSGPAYDLQYHSSGHATGRHAFYVGNTESVRIDADGIKFNGDSATANGLDDYEEGEWTPAVSGGTSAGTTTHTHQNGQYVKVGELVSVTCFVRYTAATGSGYLKLTGLPYAIGNRTQNYPVAATIVDGLNWGGGTYLQALSVPGLQETNFYYMIDDANAGRQDLTNETVAIRFTMTYRI